ncbi:amino acid adenylation domain-containing protein [Lysobacter enzymogenes]|nr:amino acid adenylation domain-containing protein [Lysobacter enzymogenes]
MPIGRAVAGVRLCLLDPRRRPVRDGDSGELWIGGAAPALGYLHQDELSAQRFPADPFDPRPGARMYRSGDLARRLPGGELEFLGRNDEQVKIRGFRVDPARSPRNWPRIRACAKPRPSRAPARKARWSWSRTPRPRPATAAAPTSPPPCANTCASACPNRCARPRSSWSRRCRSASKLDRAALPPPTTAPTAAATTARRDPAAKPSLRGCGRNCSAANASAATTISSPSAGIR